MSRNEFTNFIKCLDSYKGKEKTDFVDIMNILHVVNKDYFEKKYYKSSYVGDTFLYDKKRIIQKNATPYGNPYANPYTNVYYSLYSDSHYDFLLKDNHAIKLQDQQEPKHQEPKKKVEIQASVSCLQDLIDIVDNHMYSEDEEYNIDLKSLTSIKTELIELNNMIGMEKLKVSIINQLLYFIQDLHIRKAHNGENGTIISEFKHTVICGPPGTGKTEIAKIIGKMYSKIGILKKNIFKKVTRNDLVAGYLGQTAIKTKAVITECLGGVLFIDEAYSLANGNNDLDSYSKECIDTLCESLSDCKEDLMVIIAGYEEELNKTFFSANQGLESRFIWRFTIDDYTPKELGSIFMKKVGETDWSLYDNSVVNDSWFDKNKDNFKNYGRDMELLFTYTKISHSKRIYGKSPELRKKITIEDLNNGYELLLNNRKKVEKNNSLYGLYV
jgi:SpoVK/Ycf46/Vps4 family AAA+-type ATPase